MDSKKMLSFSLYDQNGTMQTHKNFSKNWLIIFIYPKDDTPGCTIENQDFSSMYQDFLEIGCEPVGISPDTVLEHQKFCKKFSLKQTLLSDPSYTLINFLGAVGEKFNYGKVYRGLIRSTFLINPRAEVVKCWRNVRAKGHVNRIFNELKNQKLELLCKE